MSDDPIIREIRDFRDSLAERFKDNPDGFYEWLKDCEERAIKQGRMFVTRSPRRPKPALTESDD